MRNLIFWSLAALLLHFLTFLSGGTARLPWLIGAVWTACGVVWQCSRQRRPQFSDGSKKSGSKERRPSEPLCPEPDRCTAYDLLRAAACLLVIFAHAMQADLEALPDLNAAAARLLLILSTLCLVCNPVYLMLSGALLLPWKEESPAAFYLRRTKKTVLPMLVYYAFYTWGNLGAQGTDPPGLGDALRSFCAGTLTECPHFWILYKILEFYLAVPLLRYALRAMPYRVLSALAGLIAALMTLQTFSPFQIGIYSFLSSWTGAALIGYWITRPQSRRFDRFLKTAGLLALTGTVLFLACCGSAGSGLFDGCSAISLTMACGLFSAVLSENAASPAAPFAEAVCAAGDPASPGKQTQIQERSLSRQLSQKRLWLCQLFSRLLRLFSCRGYSIVLFHWRALYFWVIGGLGLRVTSWHGLGLAAVPAATLLISLVFTFLIDHLMTEPAAAILFRHS